MIHDTCMASRVCVCVAWVKSTKMV
jgi:hypothetical protein